MSYLQPQNINDITEIIRSEKSVEIIGFGSKRQYGYPVNADATLSTQKITGVTLYEPDEMVLTVQAGTPLSFIQKLLEEHNQRLPFEPPNWNQWLAPAIQEQSIAGVVACNHSGSQRLSAGSARDHILGFRAVNGRGEIIKSGGRVVKNVTGYDLSKLMAGSFGTLAVMADLTVRTLPKAEVEATIAINIEDPEQAVQQFSLLLGKTFDIAAAAWLPDNLSQEVELLGNIALLRLEGFYDSVMERCKDIINHFSSAATLLDESTSKKLWRMLSDGSPLASFSDADIWRLSVPPRQGATILQRLPTQNAWLDWAGGLIWLAITPADNNDNRGLEIRQMLSEIGGHATLVRQPQRGDSHQSYSQPIFHPRSKALQTLTRRIKSAFDPENKLNPRRMG